MVQRCEEWYRDGNRNNRCEEECEESYHPATVVKDGYTLSNAILQSIPDRKKLSSVVIGANVTKIGAKAFYKDAN